MSRMREVSAPRALEAEVKVLACLAVVEWSVYFLGICQLRFGCQLSPKFYTYKFASIA